MKKSVIILSILFCFLISCQDKQIKAEFEELKTQAKIEAQNIEVVKKIFEEINENQNLHIYDELCDPQYQFYSPSITPNPLSLKQVKEFAKATIAAFPDVNYNIKEIFADGEYVIVWNIFNGTHEGNYQGIPATGNKIEVSSILIFRLQNGKIVEEREEADMLGAMMKFGMELQMKEKI